LEILTLDSDVRLVELLLSRNPQCVSLMYDKYSRSLFGVILRIVKGRELAEEILQDTFAKAWRNIDSYDIAKGRLYTWLVNIARNAAIDATRAKNFNRQNVPIEPIINVIDGQKNKSINTDIIGIKELTKALPPDYKLLIDLIYFEGYTQPEVAEHLSIPLGTVKTRLRSAMVILKRLF
jgi:RNA polymerase sigma-70 factor, ECF subfamily